ncbi:MAG: hypothetical protein OWQ59_00180 [Alicyclobacillaceae bacterium]|nr:hypothetical protein [Alicyclobacillaceae bacterium]MCY0894967.1 hypothetical protein [Alicyclobacillaceae bacterium]
MELLLATKNPAKVTYLTRLMGEFGIRAVSLAELDVDAVEVEESGATVEENAYLKASEYQWLTGKATLADDTGLFIEALDGFPGVQARRFHGELSDDVSDEEWLAHFLERTKHIPDEQRIATFVTGWCVVNEEGCPFYHQVRRSFTFARQPIRPGLSGWPLQSVVLETAADSYESISVPEMKLFLEETDWFEMKARTKSREPRS